MKKNYEVRSCDDREDDAVKDDSDGGNIGTCGYYCGTCSIYLAMKRGKEQQRSVAFALSKEMGRTVSTEEVQCQGCRKHTKDCWSGNCAIRSCAVSKGITYCHQCVLFPCQKLRDFSELYHDIPIIQSKELKEMSPEKWIEKMEERWSCPSCTGPVEAGTMRCWSCNRKAEKHVKGTLPGGQSGPAPGEMPGLSQRAPQGSLPGLTPGSAPGSSRDPVKGAEKSRLPGLPPNYPPSLQPGLPPFPP